LHVACPLAILPQIPSSSTSRSSHPEKTPPPIREHLDELAAIQAGYKNLNSVEEFLRDEEFIPESEEKTVHIDRAQLYRQYADCMSLQKRRPYSRTKFYNICRTMLKEFEGRSRKSMFLVRER
jgi:hypothetical protein